MLGSGVKVAEAIINIKARTQPARDEIDKLGEKMDRLRSKIAAVTFSRGIGLKSVLDGMDNLVYKTNKAAKATLDFTQRASRDFDRLGAVMRRAGHGLDNFLNPSRVITGIGGVDRAIQRVHATLRNITLSRFNLGNAVGALATGFGGELSRVFANLGRANPMQSLFNSMIRSSTFFRSLPLPFRHAVEMMARDSDRSFGRIGRIFGVMARHPNIFGFITRINGIHETINRVFGNGTVSRFANYGNAISGFFNNLQARSRVVGNNLARTLSMPFMVASARAQSIGQGLINGAARLVATPRQGGMSQAMSQTIVWMRTVGRHFIQMGNQASQYAVVISNGVSAISESIARVIGGLGTFFSAATNGLGASLQFVSGAARVFGVALSVVGGAMRVVTGLIGTLLNALKAVWDMLHALMSAIASVVEAIASAVTQVVGMIMKAAGVVGAVIVGLSIAAVKKAADIQVAYQELGRIASLAGQDVMKLRDAIIAVGTATPGTGSIKDLFELASFGARMGIGEGLEGSLKVKAIEGFTKSIARVRMALTDMPTEEAATYIVRILRVFGLGPEYIDNFASALVKLDNSSTATGRDILDLTRRLSGVLSTLGAMPSEVMGLAAAMRDAGVEVEVGGTAMSQLFIKTAYKTKDYAKALKIPFQELEHAINTKPIEALKMVLQAIGKFSPVDQLRVLSKMQLQGRQTSSVILQMANNWQMIDSFMAEGAEEWKSQNSLIEAANVRSRQFYSILEQSTNKLTSLAAKVGDMLMPAAIALAEFFGVAMDTASDFFEANRSQIEGWVSVVESGVTTAKQYLIAGFQPFYEFMDQKWREFMMNMTQSWEASWKWLTTNWKSLADWMGGTLMTVMDRVIGHLIDKMPLIGNAVQSAFSGFFKVINAAARFIDNQQNFEEVPGNVTAGGLAKRGGNLVNQAVGESLFFLDELIMAPLDKALGFKSGKNMRGILGGYFADTFKNPNQIAPSGILPEAPNGDKNAPFPTLPEFAKPDWFKGMTDPKLIQQAQEKAGELAARDYEEAVKKTVFDLLASADHRNRLANSYWERGNKIMYEAQKTHAKKELELADKIASREYDLDTANKFYGGILKGAPNGEAGALPLPKGFVPKPQMNTLLDALPMNPFAEAGNHALQTAKWLSMQAALAKQGLDNDTLLKQQKDAAARKSKTALEEYNSSLHRIAASAKDRAFLDENLRRTQAGLKPFSRKDYEHHLKLKGVDDAKIGKDNPLLNRLGGRAKGNVKASMDEATKLEKEAKEDLKKGDMNSYREKLRMAMAIRSARVSKEAAGRMQRSTLRGTKYRTPRLSKQATAKKRQLIMSNDYTALKLKDITNLKLGTVDARSRVIGEKGGDVSTEKGAMELAGKLVEEFKQGDVTTISKLLTAFGSVENLTESVARLLRETPDETQIREREHMRKGGTGIFDPLSDEMANMHNKGAGEFTGLVEFSRKLQSSALSKEDIPKKQLKALEQIAENTEARNPANMTEVNNFGGAVAQ